MSFSSLLLHWYDEHKRDLPWRRPPCDPYKVWVSEIMLQQTTVTTVIPYFHRFIERFSCVRDLACASIEDVFFLWQGLGYYRRAGHMHKAARSIADHGFPQTQKEWQALPGIGPYTSAAIMAIAFDQPAVAVDGNIARIMSRYYGHDGCAFEKQVAQSAMACLPSHRYGDYTQALMDLGSQVCRPKSPLCEHCPLQEGCYAFQKDCVERFPPVKKRIKKNRYGHVFIVRRDEGSQGYVALTKNSPNSLLKGLWGFPTTMWERERAACFSGKWRYQGKVHHVFTHFDLELDVWMGGEDAVKGAGWIANKCEKGEVEEFLFEGGEEWHWVRICELPTYALSTLMRKVQAVCLL